MSKLFASLSTSLIFMFVCLNCALAQEVFVTQPKSDDIKSIQLFSTTNSYLLPIIKFNSDDKIQIKFDNLNISQPRLRYKLFHCNYDWTLSDIPEIDYLEGFNDNPIHEYSFSSNTLINYVHYNLEFPNSDVSFKVSGNYVLAVYDEYYPEDILLTACFSVVDSKVQVAAAVTGNTDIDFNSKHQQLGLDINYKNINVQNPDNDFKVVVRQNIRFDNRIENIKPTYHYSDRIVFERHRGLIFEGGNEYRRFEIVNSRYGGLGVSRLEYQPPYTSVYINTDKIRANGSRQYDQDQNGKYLVRNTEAVDNDTESDYFLVHFTLEANKNSIPGIAKKIFLDGEFTYGSPIEMEYDIESSTYRTSVLLKQGAYNYQYLDNKENIKSTASIEGNYFNTENAYSVFVYYRPSGRRYDMLVGFLQIESVK